MKDYKLLAEDLERAKRRGIYFDFLALTKITVAIITALVFSAIGGDDAYFYTSYILGGISLLLVAYIFCKTYGLDIKEEFSLKKTDKANYLYSALLLFAMMFGLSGLNGYFIKFLENFGYKYQDVVFPKLSAFNYVAVVLTVCVIPAITEEIAFRGMILNGIKAGGKIGSAIMIGFLFAIYHASPAQTIYQFLVGFLFALLAFESGSVFPTVIVHFLNNFIIVNLCYFAGGNMDFGEAWNIILTVAGVIATVAFIYIMLRRKDQTKGDFARKWLLLRSFMLFALLGIIAYGALWIASLIG